jgi:hypothetical protein
MFVTLALDRGTTMGRRTESAGTVDTTIGEHHAQTLLDPRGLHRRLLQYVSRCSRPCCFICAPTTSQSSPAFFATSLIASTTPSSIDFSPQT